MLEIVTRSMWKAADPVTEEFMNYPVRHIFWMPVRSGTCTTHETCSQLLKKIQSYNQIEQRQRDIRYNFLVREDGVVYEGRGWRTRGLLPITYSSLQKDSFIIGFLGDYSVRNMPPKMMTAGHNIIQYGVKMGFLSRKYENHDLMDRFEK